MKDRGLAFLYKAIKEFCKLFGVRGEKVRHWVQTILAKREKSTEGVIEKPLRLVCFIVPKILIT